MSLWFCILGCKPLDLPCSLLMTFFSMQFIVLRVQAHVSNLPFSLKASYLTALYDQCCMCDLVKMN